MIEKCDTTSDFNFDQQGLSANVVDSRGRSIAMQANKEKRKAGASFLNILKFFMKHVGLLVVLIAYMVAGGFLFQALELNNESSTCFQKQAGYLEKLNESSERVISTTKAVSNDLQAKQMLVREAMSNFAEELFVLDFQPSTNCTAILESNSGNWNFGNSIYFCATILTTIGYGHIAPKTFWGRITCIIYAIVGIPFMLVYLALIGGLLARGFRFVYVNFICCRCFYDSIYRKRRARRERLLQWEADLREHEAEEARRRGLPLPPTRAPTSVEDEDEELDDPSGEIVAVPLTVSVVVLSLYTMIGAAIFSMWENWELMDGAYFSFITISTIGLGDLVPGTGRLQDPETTIELIVGAIYLLIGLSLLSMCINLLQEEMVAKFRYIAQCCGARREEDKEAQEIEERETMNEYAARLFAMKQTEPDLNSTKDPMSTVETDKAGAFDNVAYEENETDKATMQ